MTECAPHAHPLMALALKALRRCLVPAILWRKPWVLAQISMEKPMEFCRFFEQFIEISGREVGLTWFNPLVSTKKVLFKKQK